MNRQRLQLNTDDLKTTLENLDDDAPLYYEELNDGTVRIVVHKWSAVGNTCAEPLVVASSESICKDCIGCVPRVYRHSPAQAPRSLYFSCLRLDVSDMLSETMHSLESRYRLVHPNPNPTAVSALNLAGNPVPPEDKAAVTFSVTGMFQRVAHDTYEKPADALLAGLYCLRSAATANAMDSPDTFSHNLSYDEALKQAISLISAAMDLAERLCPKDWDAIIPDRAVLNAS